jgi:hypothetical protein
VIWGRVDRPPALRTLGQIITRRVAPTAEDIAQLEARGFADATLWRTLDELNALELEEVVAVCRRWAEDVQALRDGFEVELRTRFPSDTGGPLPLPERASPIKEV